MENEGGIKIIENLGLKDKHRIESWLKEARSLSKDDYFKKMIFYWISFNCYYGKRYRNPWTDAKDSKTGGEPGKIRTVLNHIRREELGERESERFLNENHIDIEIMINHMSPEYYCEQVSKFQNHLKNKHYRTACVELIILIEKVRNRLFHGAKTYDLPHYGNKEVLPSCCNILNNLMTKLGFPDKL